MLLAVDLTNRWIVKIVVRQLPSMLILKLIYGLSKAHLVIRGLMRTRGEVPHTKNQVTDDPNLFL
jgi:hypothetical protein